MYEQLCSRQELGKPCPCAEMIQDRHITACRMHLRSVSIYTVLCTDSCWMHTDPWTASSKSTPCPPDSRGTGWNLRRKCYAEVDCKIRWLEARVQWGYPDGWNQYWHKHQRATSGWVMRSQGWLLYFHFNCNCQRWIPSSALSQKQK